MKKQLPVRLFLHCLVTVCLLQIFGACHRTPSSIAALDKLRSASDLASAEFVIGKTIIADQSKKVLGVISLNDAVFFARSRAIVKTGIDLGALSPADVKVDESNAITLQLPPVKVISFNYPPESIQEIKAYTHLHPFDNRITAADMDQILQLAQSQVMESLDHLQIRSVTEDKMRNLLTGLLRQEGFEQVFITFKQSNQPLMNSGE